MFCLTNYWLAIATVLLITVAFYFSNNTTILILYIDFYLILLHVSAVYCSLHQVGLLVHKNNTKAEKPVFTNSGYKVTIIFRLVILKNEIIINSE